MGVVTYESEHDGHEASVTVDQREPGDNRAPWAMISVEIDGHERMTPKELRRLGRWLQQEGTRIGREFKSNGAPKQ
ncbi:hypothetical protein PRZ61_10705 [Halomonas pacifica]|uniref:hypothetical protein n=1 Tax=Bisbaumannia pacifica TaxID=77098 RepID=UPI0023584487|nr:hypothetical protein [Halomonas pacifica]MDC8803905.1 hypothetical protein [Halomonas pacifica]